MDLDAYAAWLDKCIRHGTCVGVAADEHQAVVAGAVLLDWRPTCGDTSSKRARITKVFTEPARRGRGIARSLVEQVMDACAARDVRTFGLATSTDGSNMYRSLGFVPYEHEMVLHKPR